MNIHNHYPDKPFAPETQTEWVRFVLELIAACSKSVLDTPKKAD